MRLILAAIVALSLCATADAQVRGVQSGRIRGVQSGAVRGTPNYNRGGTTIYNPYNVRDGESYRYGWRRHNGHTDIVVVPDYNGNIQIYNRPSYQQYDHWDRARADYFQQMYGPGGVYSRYYR